MQRYILTISFASIFTIVDVRELSQTHVWKG